MKNHNIALFLMISLSMACADDAGSGASASYGKASFALGAADDSVSGVDDNPGADDAARGPIMVAEQGGEQLQLERAQVYLRHIELELPAGVTCADVADSIGAGVRCEAGEDRSGSGVDDNPGADDNGGRGGVDDNPGVDDNGAGVDDSGARVKLRIAGPFVVDLIARTATPSLSGIQIPALNYRRVDMRIDDGDPRDGLISAGSALDDHSWSSALSWSHDGQPYTVELALKFNEDVRIEPAGGVQVGSGESLLVLFDATSWLKALPLAKCLDDGDVSASAGTIVLDDRASGGCADVEDALKDAIKGSGRMRRGR
jgi:hypothetical protein